MMPEDPTGQRIGKEGISRTLTERFILRDTPHSQGLYLSPTIICVTNIDEVMDRVRIDAYTEAATGNGSILMYQVGQGIQETWLAYRLAGNVGTFDYRLNVASSVRDGNANMYFEAAVASTAEVQRVLASPLKLNADWSVNIEVTNLTVAGNVFLRVWKTQRVWRHFDSE